MRPLRLSLKGFTAFRDEQTLDFENLDLFAIAGPTGSGKSSILDAITYALFGYVDRVGRQVGQLVSQGQPRMAVTLEFAVGERRFRVTRTTPARGASRILLERWDEGEWRQAGEGADRVRDADAMIERALGLDYAAFTRSVLLPQGKFAEFLVGDAASRRKILTELLGLELFERLLRTEYAGVTEERIQEAEAGAERAADLDRRLGAAERSVREIAGRWDVVEREVAELAARANEASELAKAEADWGRARDLGALLAKAEGLAEAREGLAGLEAEAKRAAGVPPKLEKALATAERELEMRVRAVEAAMAALEGAREQLDAAQHANLVAAVRAGVRVGEACPVCGAKVTA